MTKMLQIIAYLNADLADIFHDLLRVVNCQVKLQVTLSTLHLTTVHQTEQETETRDNRAEEIIDDILADETAEDKFIDKLVDGIEKDAQKVEKNAQKDEEVVYPWIYLGAPFFRNYIVQIDFETNEVQFSSKTVTSPWKKSSGMSSGVVAGISIGVLLGLFGLVVLAACCIKGAKTRKELRESQKIVQQVRSSEESLN